MKGCLKTIGGVIFWTAIVIIGVNTCDLLTTPTTVTSPQRDTLTSPEVTPTVSPAPIRTSTPTPESVPTISKIFPSPTISFPTNTSETTISTDSISVIYSWIYNTDWTWEIKIPRALYEYYQNLPRPPTKNYSVYVTHPLDDPYIDALVEKLTQAANQKGYSDYETIELAIAFVQSLPYTVDSVTTPYDEYPRYPIETLVDNGGDCEDTSILLASIIDSMGYGTVLIILPEHVGIGVKGGENTYGTYWEYKGDRYYYIETTGENWGIGELPQDYGNTKATIRPMVPVPILTHEWSAKSSGYMAEVEVNVINLGTAAANNVTVFAGFDADGEKVWNAEECEPFSLGVGQQATVSLNLRIPFGEHTRLIVQIAMDDVLVDEGFGDWFDT